MLFKLAQLDTLPAQALYTRLTGAWGVLPTRKRVTIKVNIKELRLLLKLKLPNGVLDLNQVRTGWVTVYRHPTKDIELKVYTRMKPAKRRSFKVKGSRRLFKAVSVTNLNKEAVMPATKTKKKSTKSKKSEEELELEELEDLEDLDDEDLEDEEPDDEEDEDEEEDEDDEEDEDEDDDDEEDEPPAKKSKAKTSKAKAAKTAKAKKSRKKPVEDDDEDEEEEKPKKKSSKTKSTKAKKGSKAAPGEKIASGKLSPADVADLSDGAFDARQIRLFLRANADEWPKEEGFRYAFTKKEAQQLIKAMKRDRA